jgi:hypothetical protein
MSYNKITRRADAKLYFSDAVTFTASGYTSELDLENVDYAKGSPIEVAAKLNTLTGSAATTVQFGVVSGTATAPTTNILTLPALTAAGEHVFTLPASSTSRYVRLSVTITGSAASTANVTAFAFV